MFKNIIYSLKNSRPSKTLLDPVLYNEFKKINIDLYEKCKTYSIIECSHNIKEEYHLIKDFTYFSEVLEIIYNFPSSNFLIEINEVYTYPQIQFIELLNFLFKSIDFNFSRFTNVCYVYCKNLTCLGSLIDKYYCNCNCEIILKKSIIKDFGIKVPPELIEMIYNYNDDYFKKIINLDNTISSIYNESLDLNEVNKEIDVMNDYYISYINKNNDYKVCNCDKLFNSKLLDCYICEKCYSLIKITSPVSEVAKHPPHL